MTAIRMQHNIGKYIELRRPSPVGEELPSIALLTWQLLMLQSICCHEKCSFWPSEVLLPLFISVDPHECATANLQTGSVSQ